jgi:ParB-like nuclease domain
MSKIINHKPPTWLEKNPKPKLENHRFHDRQLQVWVGEVSIDKIEGWQGNPRTELLRDQFYETFARYPTDEEMCQLVLSDEDEKEGLKIKELAANIRKNGVRVPIVLTYEAKLLDGNRRYYASTFLVNEGVERSERKEFAQIPAYVLPKDIDAEVEHAIITEFNFAANMQLEWPYFIRAHVVYADHTELGLSRKELERKYGVPWRYLSKWIAAAELCDRFLKYYDEVLPARQFAYRNFIMFDEMMRNYGSRLKDADFRESIFKALLTGYEPENHKHHTFTKSSDVLRLDEIYDHDEAWQALVSGKGNKALRDALGILEMSNLGGASDPTPALKRVVNGLEKLVKNRALPSADQELLQSFHEYSQQIPGGPTDPDSQISQMIEWLEAMSAKQIAELGKGAVSRLKNALTLVIKMSNAARRKT